MENMIIIIIIIAAKTFASLIVGAAFLLFLRILNASILKPRRLRSRIEKQGIKGPRPSFLYGNIPEMNRIIQLHNSSVKKTPKTIDHAWFPIVFPHLERWINEYGPIFLFSSGHMQQLYITDPDMVKELTLYTSLNLGKPKFLSTERGPLLGRGIISSNGRHWAYQRKIIGSEFYPEKVKSFVNLVTESTLAMLKSWEDNTAKSQGKSEIVVDGYMRSLSADIISRACFGSCYAQGEQIFSKLLSLQSIMSKGHMGIPGLRHLPTNYNKKIWKLEREIDSMILDVIKRSSNDGNDKKDLLQLLLSAAESCGEDSAIPADITPNKFVVDNCKNIYFAGHETTASTTTWCMMALAAYPDWQARARQEVLQVCGINVPTADMLRNLKVLTMVIYETLRLYPPIAYLVREPLQDIHLKGLTIPIGINVLVPISLMHQRQDLWGPDAHLFNPERFTNGTTGACKIPQAFMPFGTGPRTCVGQHFAMTEMKLFLSLTLSRFRLSLSPEYQHSPVFRLFIQPQHGVRIIIEKL